MIIDTHAHIFWDSFKQDYDEIIQRAISVGLTKFINIGVDVETSKMAVELKSDQIEFYSAIGIHPHEAIRYSQGKQINPDVSIHEDIEKLEGIFKSYPEKVVAVGECGLDFFFENNPNSPVDVIASEAWQSTNKELQQKLLQAQIDLAKKLNLPLSIHCRDDRSKDASNSECWDKTLEMVADHFGVLHCYSGLPQTTQKALQTNFLFSFAGNITYPKNEYLREAIKIIPLDKIAIETDCPFLPPQKYRGTRNEPSYIIETLKCIAEIKNQDLKEIEEAIYQNTLRVFQLTV